jgi:hypothetical protein
MAWSHAMRTLHAVHHTTHMIMMLAVGQNLGLRRSHQWGFARFMHRPRSALNGIQLPTRGTHVHGLGPQ